MKYIIFFTLLSGCTLAKLDYHSVNTNENPKKSTPLKLLVGTYTGKSSKGIYQFNFDPIHGTLTKSTLLVETSNPSFLSVSNDNTFIYAVNEDKNGKVSSFKWNDKKTRLLRLNQLSSEGSIPCHSQLSPSENLLAISNYKTGNFSIFALKSDGAINTNPKTIQHEGSGPSLPYQASARGHAVKFGPEGKFLYAVDLGIDQIVTYPINGNNSIGNATSRFNLDPGDGPRHLVFHPTLNLAFVVNEQSATVVSMAVDYSTGALKRIDKQSTLPSQWSGKISGADIQITSKGHFLYTSNRGHDSIAIFAVSEEGHLKPLGHESVLGSWPRSLALSPDGKFLLAANQKSNNITVFAVNQKTGLLTHTGQNIEISTPATLKFIDEP